MPTVEPPLSEDFLKLIVWADKYKRMHIFATTADDTPQSDVVKSVSLGVDGLMGVSESAAGGVYLRADAIEFSAGVCLSDTTREQEFWLAKLETLYMADYSNSLSIMGEKPFFPSLLDPSLILNSLPTSNTELMTYANTLGFDFAKCSTRVDLLKV